jgi:hypothetical protein
MLIGNIHLRDCAVNMKIVLNNKVKVFSVVKPGCHTGPIWESGRDDIAKLTNDVLIICSSSDDLEHNSSIAAYNQIVNFINKQSHINIILLSVPFRYDLPASLHINREIESFNRKFMEPKLKFFCVNFFEIKDIRHCFTSHGLHLNKAEEELLANDLSCSLTFRGSFCQSCELWLSW